MIKYPVVNGRYIEQRICDYCGRTIYMREPYKHMAYRFKSYIRAKDSYKSMNPLRIHIMDLWNEDSHMNICQDCMDHNPDRPSRYDTDTQIIDNVERCFYTNDPKSILNTGQVDKTAPSDIVTHSKSTNIAPVKNNHVPVKCQPPTFNLKIEKRYIKDYDGTVRAFPDDFFEEISK